MAAVSQIDIEKVYLGEFFSNRYLCSLAVSGTIGDAVVAAVVAAEKQAMYDQVFFLRARHSTLTPGDDVYRNYVLTGSGVRPTPVDGLLPQFNVIRVDFQPTAGRPSRKYLRGTLAEKDIVGSTIDPILIGTNINAYIAAIVAEDDIVDPQGDDLVSGTAIPTVAMRQLRRGSKRRTTPVL